MGCALALVVPAGCGGISEDVDDTVATVVPVRGHTELGSERAAVVARASAGQPVQTDEAGLTRLTLDSGPRVLLDRSTHVEVGDGGSLTASSGRLFVEAAEREALQLSTPGGSLRASDASFSARIDDSGTEVYVVRGEVSWTRGDERGVVAAGEQLTLGDEVQRTAATLWQDWTGGLARPGPGQGAGPEGVGMLEARVPDEVGLARWPLVVRRLDVRVRIEGDVAVTEVDQLFFNPASETVEGLYRIRAPDGAVLQRFAVDRDERLVDGYVRERAQARQAYDRQVYRGSTEDPALLEWDAPGSYRARIYPIAAGETRRIVIRYAEWLRSPAGGQARMYRYPMGGGSRAPHIQEFALSADVADAGAERVRAGMGATVEEGAVRIRRSDFSPRADFWLELVGGQGETQRAWTAPHEPPPRAPDAPETPHEADERDYFYLPLVLPTSLASEASAGEEIDLVVLADVSAATDRSHLELGRSVVESLAAHLGPEDRVAVVSADLTIRSVIEGQEPELRPATPEHLEQTLDGLARVSSGGATDLGEALASAVALLDPARGGAVIYVGDGAPTVGELRADGLLEQLGRLPHPARLYAVAVGSDANLELLDAVTRGSGLARRVEERAGAADAALSILSHASRPIAHGVEVDLGTGIENAFPRRPMDAVLGEVFPVVGRVREDVPSEVTVTGTIGGEPFEERITIEPRTTDRTTDLRLRWAQERLRQLLLEGAGREEVAELGTRYGLITPFTSYYVPSRRELSTMGASALRWIDQPLLPVGRRARGRTSWAGTIAAVALGPLAIAGCTLANEEAEPAASADTATAGLVEEEWGAEGERNEQPGSQDPSGSNRFGIQGPAGGQPDPRMAREAAREAAPRRGPIQRMRDQADMQQADMQQADMEPRDMRPRDMEQAGEAEESSAPTARRRVARPTASAAPAAPAMPGEASALDDDPMAAMGALMGDSVGEPSSGTGRGGGGTGEGTIGLGNLGTIGQGAGGGGGSGYGRGAGGLRARAGVVPRVRSGRAEVRGSLSREVIRRVIRRHINEARFCYEQQLGPQPDLEGSVRVQFIIAATGAVQTAAVASSTLDDAQVEQCLTAAVRRWRFPAPDGGGVVRVTHPFHFSAHGSRAQVTSGEGGGAGQPAEAVSEQPRVLTRIVHTTDHAAHRARRCSDAAALPLADRRALWRERLGQQSSAAGWVRLYREAVRACEARSWRDRRTFLALMLGRAGTIQNMVSVHRLLSDASSRSFTRASILRRVRTPEDLRAVRGAFAMAREVDWGLVDQILERAPDDAAKARALRRLTMQYPDSFELKLRLMAVLERAGRGAEAKRLADRMRADPYADPGVRTAIGEMYLRLGEPDEARRVFSEIVEFAPLDELARRRLGDLYRAHGWHEDAYRQYQTLSEIRPDDPTVLLLLAQAAAGAGRVDEALRLEKRLMETAQPGASEGVARTALLWSSVRFSRLRSAARSAGDDERLEQLDRRRRRSGILREAGPLRATLVWSHPDAQLSLWAAHPGLSPTRPADISPEFGIEAFHLEEQESGEYRLQVRRARDDDDLSDVSAQLVVVWSEGEEDEQVEIVDLAFDAERDLYAWTVTGRTLTEAAPGEGR